MLIRIPSIHQNEIISESGTLVEIYGLLCNFVFEIK